MSPPHAGQRGGRCLCPPHPDLLARLMAEAKDNASTPEQAETAQETLKMVGRTLRTGNVYGLNDAVVRPPPGGGGGGDTAPGALSVPAEVQEAPLRGVIRLIVVLVDFSDQVMLPGTKAKMEKLFFGAGSGTVASYYADVSHGLVSMAGDVVGPFRMPLKMTDYAHKAFGVEDPDTKKTPPSPNLRTLGKDALEAAKDHVYSPQLDNDGDGYVDAFVVVHAGPGGEVTGDVNNLWSAKWVIDGVETEADIPEVNGVKVFAFLTVPEDAGLGVCAHELGHLVFGWPDLYDRDESSFGIGVWCLMAIGNWLNDGKTPCHPSAWCKASPRASWVTVVVDKENGPVKLQDVKSGHEVRRLWKDGDEQSGEYFLVENRQQTGYDKFIPGKGLFVWHVFEDSSETQNDDEYHPLVGLVQADGAKQMVLGQSPGDSGDPFPGIANNVTFSEVSNPSSLSYFSRSPTHVSITKISKPGPLMTMNVTVKAPAPATGSAS